MIRKLVAALVVALIALCAAFLWCYSEVVVTVPVNERLVALTFDDGPNPPHTQALLAMLDRQGVKATFFLKGRNVEAFPETVLAVVAGGHEIGNHSYSHPLMISLGKADMLSEVARTNAVIEKVLGYAPVLFRPPYGIQGPGLKLALAELDMPSIAMSDHGTDWEVTDPEEIARAVLADIAPGSIVLLHDGHGDVDDPQAQDSRAPTIAATAIIIEALRNQGYRFVTVGELLALAEH